MNYICLDTCTWIYLANGTEPARFLDFILEQSKKKNLKVIVPKTIIDEWNENKDNAVSADTKKLFSKILQDLGSISKLLGEKGTRPLHSFLLETDDNSEYFTDVVKKVKAQRQLVLNKTAENVQKVNNIFADENTAVVSISSTVRLLAGEFALAKKAPFKKKNSFADALILFAFVEYVSEMSISEASFISYNIHDFC